MMSLVRTEFILFVRTAWFMLPINALIMLAMLWVGGSDPTYVETAMVAASMLQVIMLVSSSERRSETLRLALRMLPASRDGYIRARYASLVLISLCWVALNLAILVAIAFVTDTATSVSAGIALSHTSVPDLLAPEALMNTASAFAALLIVAALHHPLALRFDPRNAYWVLIGIVAAIALALFGIDQLFAPVNLVPIVSWLDGLSPASATAGICGLAALALIVSLIASTIVNRRMDQ